MDLIIKSKTIAVGDSCVVRNNKGEDILQINGRLISFTNKKTITDMKKNIKYIVKGKLFEFSKYTAFIYDNSGTEIAKVIRDEYTLGLPFKVESKIGNFKILCNHKDIDCQIYLDDKKVAYTSKNDSLPFSFKLSITEKENYEFYIAMIVAINILQKKTC